MADGRSKKDRRKNRTMNGRQKVGMQTIGAAGFLTMLSDQTDIHANQQMRKGIRSGLIVS
jgi:hypothetical protein